MNQWYNKVIQGKIKPYNYSMQELLNKMEANTNYEINSRYGRIGLDFLEPVLIQSPELMMSIIEHKNPTINEYLRLHELSTQRAEQSSCGFKNEFNEFISMLESKIQNQELTITLTW